MPSRIAAYIAVAAAALALGGCASNLKDAQMTEATGAEFRAGLIDGYKGLAALEQAEADWIDARVFSDRVLALAAGGDVMPEALSMRRLPADRVLALEIARARLDTILEEGGRETAGAATAMAQVGFDCWMQEQEENFQPDDIANCMRMFEQGASAAEKALRPPSQSPSPSTPSSAPSPSSSQSSSQSSTPSSAPSPKPVDTGPWEIYFAWDSAAIGAAAQQEINRAYTSFGKLAGSVMHISGHADTSGPSGYNQKLSERRAHTVYEVFTLDLLAPEDRVTVRAVGEKELAVKTPDNTREVLNRRVVLRLTK